MSRKKNKVLAFILAVAMVVTSFGSDLAVTRAYAVESEEDLEELKSRDIATADWEVIPDGEQDNSAVSSATEGVVNDAIEDAAVTASEAEESSAVSDTTVTEAVIDNSDVLDSTEASASLLSSDVNLNAATSFSSSEEDLEASASLSSSGEDLEASASLSSSQDESGAACSSLEEKNVTVEYRATKGGSVSVSKETVNILDEKAEFKGATATAWNDEYKFVDWTDEDGNQISTESTIIPSDISEDKIYTANFIAVEDISDKMPGIEKEGVHEGGVVVSVKAEEGIFPAGTEVVITAVSDEQALDTAKDALGENITVAKGVDISFVYEGNEIQPADFNYVHVTLALEENLEGDNFSVLHDHGSEVDVIEAEVSKDEDGKVESVEFDTNEFSIFIIAGDGENSSTDTDDGRAVATIRFYKEEINSGSNEVIFEKLVKKGDAVANPGIPTIKDNQEFIGWYIDGDNSNESNRVSFSPSDEDPSSSYIVDHVVQDEIIEVYPVIRSTYYVTFIGSDGEIARVKQVIVNKEEDKTLDLSNITIPAPAGRAFKGWSTEKDNEEKIVSSINVTTDSLMLYAIIVDAFWIRFEGNVCGGWGSTYTGPVFVENGDTLRYALSKVTTVPERTGYTFKGWSFYNEVNNTVLTEADLDTEIQDVSETFLDKKKDELYLYAVWTPNDKTKLTIIEWHQNATLDGYDYAKNWVFEGATGVTTNSTVTVAESKGKVVVSTSKDGAVKTIDKFETGFNYDTSLGSYYTIKNSEEEKNEQGEIIGNKDTTIVEATGDTVVNIYVQRKEIKVEFKLLEWVYKQTNDNYGSLYGLVGGNYVELGKYGNSWYYYGGQYRGKRYKKSLEPTDYKIFTGKYGQTYSQTNQSWPSEYQWYEEYDQDGVKGTHYTFLDSFLLDQTLYGEAAESVGHTFYHYKQNIDGSYSLDGTATTTVTGKGGKFGFTDKYNAFSVSRYLQAGSLINTNWQTWKKCHDDLANPSGEGDYSIDLKDGDNLYILHERHKFDLTLRVFDPVSGNETDTTISGIPYEQVLNDNSKVAPYAKADYTPGKKQGYSFGWYKDPLGTTPFDFSMQMPDGGAVAYGIYKPVEYTITLIPDGGTFVAGLAGLNGKDPATFMIKSTEEVDRDNLITGIKKDNYELTGWYYPNGQEFKYGRVTEDTTLIAVWRYQGYTKVVYKAGDHFSFDGGKKEFIPDYNYATDSSVVVAAPPTTTINDEVNKKYYTFIGWEVKGNQGKTYYPNDVFTINSKLIDAGEERSGVRYVVVNAVYKETGEPGGEDEKTLIIYDPNIAGQGADAGQAQITESQLKVNKSITVRGATFTKARYKQTSWNTSPDGSGLTVNFKDSLNAATIIGADNVNRAGNSNANILYAQYEPVELVVEIKGSSIECPYNNEWITNKEYTINSATYYDANDNKVTVFDFTIENVNYKGSGIKEKDVKLDANNKVIAYEIALSANDFEPKNSAYQNVRFVIDPNNSKLKLTIKEK